MTKLLIENIGPPDINIAGLKIWVHGYQFVEADNYDDANWLRVSVNCGANNASIWASGSIITVNDIIGLASDSEKLYQKEIKKLEIDPMEPELRITMKAIDSLGHLDDS